MRRSPVLLFAALLAASTAAAQVPARPDTVVRDTSRAARLPEIKVTVTRVPEPLARVPYAIGVLDRTAIQRGQQTTRHRRGVEQHPRRRGQPTGTTSRSTSGSRSAGSAAGPTSACAASRSSGWHTTDPARRSEPVDQHRLRRYRPGRGPEGGQLLALRQRLRRRDRAPDRARRGGAVRPARAGPGRQRQAERRRVLQVAELDLGPLRSGERHALGVAVQGRRVPAAQRRGDPPAQRRRGLRLRRLDPRHAPAQPRRQSRGAESRGPDARRVRGQRRFGGGEQHRARRRQGRPAAAARARGQALRRRGERVRHFAVRRAPGPGEPARRAAGHQSGPDRGDLCRDRPGRRRRPPEHDPAAWHRARRRRDWWPARTCSGSGTTGRISSPTPAGGRTWFFSTSRRR